MTIAQLDQYATLKAIAAPTAQQTAVLAAIVALGVAEGNASAVTPVPAGLVEANDVLEDAIEALPKA